MPWDEGFSPWLWCQWAQNSVHSNLGCTQAPQRQDWMEKLQAAVLFQNQEGFNGTKGRAGKCQGASSRVEKWESSHGHWRSQSRRPGGQDGKSLPLRMNSGCNSLWCLFLQPHPSAPGARDGVAIAGLGGCAVPVLAPPQLPAAAEPSTALSHHRAQLSSQKGMGSSVPSLTSAHSREK